MCRSIVDIKSSTAEIRQGIKKKKPQDKNIMSASATQGGHNEYKTFFYFYYTVYTCITGT